MSKLEELIKEKCPNGVEYKQLEKLTSEINIGINPRNFFELNPNNATGFYVTVRELNGLNGVKQYDKTDLINDKAVKIINERAHIEVGDILFSNTGTVGKMALVDREPTNWGVNEGIYVIKPIDSLINSKYLYYYLDSSLAYNDYSKKFTGSTLKHVTQQALKQLRIPVPPLEVQNEIVHILDDFTSLEAELEAELEARKKQYEYYRNKLLNFDETANPCGCTHTHTHTRGYSLNDVRWVKLGDFCKRLKGTAITAGKMKEIANDNGNVTIFAGGKTMIQTDESNVPSEDIIKVPNIIVQSRGIIDFIYFDKPCSYKREMWSYTIDNEITLKYIYYYLKKNIEYFRKRGSQMGSMPQISLDVTEKYIIPIPKFEIQEKIVKILDKFNKLCNDLSEGLPAEIEARQKQYVYYRDKLLTFKEKISE